MWANRSLRSDTPRWMAAAGLLSSWASPAESFPSASIFSRCWSSRDDSRTRSVIWATSRAPTSGIRSSISQKWSLWTVANRRSPTAIPSPSYRSIRENGRSPETAPARTVPNGTRWPFLTVTIW